MTPDEILDAASKIVDERWCRGTLIQHRPGEESLVCAVGALREAAGATPEEELSDVPAENWDVFMDSHLALSETLGGVSVPAWNDHFAVDSSEVSARMREAAANLRIASGS